MSASSLLESHFLQIFVILAILIFFAWKSYLLLYLEIRRFFALRQQIKKSSFKIGGIPGNYRYRTRFSNTSFNLWIVIIICNLMIVVVKFYECMIIFRWGSRKAPSS